MKSERAVEFYKVQASGNDFILIDRRKGPKLNYKKFAVKSCQRKIGIGADGVLVIEPSKRGEFKMRIFNADGSEAQMCGNGARCVALWAEVTKSCKKKGELNFDTVAGLLKAKVKSASQNSASVALKMTDPWRVKLDMPLKVLGRTFKLNYINTGVPHTIMFVEGLDKIDVAGIGSAIRFHSKFRPAGTNVNFVEIRGANSIGLRTYERGVEAETLACGTGAVASAIITSLKLDTPKLHNKLKVLTKSKEDLEVYFMRHKDKVSDVWLQGRADLVYQGKLNGGKLC
ncbi:MAG: diaminopimelate epimerase [Candidatus Omnitrophota bacterium]|nr:MAG: diaminopimelate epimerase [Candidatus Omnitrophota bacterium]